MEFHHLIQRKPFQKDPKMTKNFKKAYFMIVTNAFQN